MANTLEKSLFTDIPTDLELTLIDDETKIEINVHKIILYMACDYFKKLLTGFKEKDLNKITINVPNSHVMNDIIMGFYKLTSNVGNLPDWQHEIEYMICCDFLGIKFNFDRLNKLVVPMEGIYPLIILNNITGYHNEIYNLLKKIVPVSVFGTINPENIINYMPKDYDLTKINKGLINKIINHSDRMIVSG